MADNYKNAIGPFSSKEAIVLTGFSRTMLDYLVRSKLHVPNGKKHSGKRGARRCYSFGDIVTLRAIANLLNAGVSVTNLSRALKKLSTSHKEITPEKLPGKYLVTDGKDIFFRDMGNLLENLSKNGQLAFSFVIDVQPISDHVVKVANSKKFRSIA